MRCEYLGSQGEPGRADPLYVCILSYLTFGLSLSFILCYCLLPFSLSLSLRLSAIAGDSRELSFSRDI